MIELNDEFDPFMDFTLFMVNNNISLTRGRMFPLGVVEMYANEKIRELVSVLYSRVKDLEGKTDDH